jgi:hypothetical protein
VTDPVVVSHLLQRQDVAVRQRPQRYLPRSSESGGGVRW